MRQSFNNIAVAFNRLTGRFAFERKKTVLALSLIILMIFMWVKLLNNKTPQRAGSLPVQQNDIGGNVAQASNVSFAELPKIKGRNDLLARDFFTVGNWQSFLNARQGQNAANLREVNTTADGAKEISSRIAEKLKLEVIDWGKNPQAFINNRLLSMGDKLTVSDGSKLYECEVVKIWKDMVLMKCGHVEIKLKLAQTAEVTN